MNAEINKIDLTSLTELDLSRCENLTSPLTFRKQIVEMNLTELNISDTNISTLIKRFRVKILNYSSSKSLRQSQVTTR